MTNEQAIKWLKDYIQNTPFQMEQYERAFDMAIQALSQEPCDDAISREDALKLIYDFKEKHTEDREKHPINYGTLLDLIRLIRELPPVTHKSGKWILLDECANSGYYCSECHKKLVKEGWSNTVKKINYCPNCGAKMESEDKECTKKI